VHGSDTGRFQTRPVGLSACGFFCFSVAQAASDARVCTIENGCAIAAGNRPSQVLINAARSVSFGTYVQYVNRARYSRITIGSITCQEGDHVARRQASAPAIPARRRRKAEAAVAKPPAPLTPEQIQRVKQHAARQVVAEMQAQINQAIAEEQADWQAAAGRPMPMNLKQLVIEAGVVGVSSEDIALAQERAEKTGDRFGFDEVKDKIAVANILRDQRIEDEIRTRLAVAAATPVTEVRKNPGGGRNPQDDNELEARLFDSWTSYRDDPNIVDKDDKDDWLETLKEIRDEQSPIKKSGLKRRYLRLLRNTYERHRSKAAALKAQTPRRK